MGLVPEHVEPVLMHQVDRQLERCVAHALDKIRKSSDRRSREAVAVNHVDDLVPGHDMRPRQVLQDGAVLAGEYHGYCEHFERVEDAIGGRRITAERQHHPAHLGDGERLTHCVVEGELFLHLLRDAPVTATDVGRRYKHATWEAVEHCVAP
eukprot:588472-Pleurochrysis_carterae.AAC.5